MELVDTHCHVQSADPSLANDPVQAKWFKAGKKDALELIQAARKADVTRLICVGTTPSDSLAAVNLAKLHDKVWASIGIHPHEAERYIDDQISLSEFTNLITQPKVVAVGECGLDYYYLHSPKKEQEAILRLQLSLAQKHKKPLIFHVREAFDGFISIVDEYPGITGVVHSFSATTKELKLALDRGFYIGLNGIMTFTKNPLQLEAAKMVPQDRLLLETDAPFLTPTPYRGTICEPKHVKVVAEFLSNLRGETLKELASFSTKNAQTLFGLS